MARPRECDWQAAVTLSACVVTLDPTQKQGPLNIDVSRRSTDLRVAVVGGAVVQVTTQRRAVWMLSCEACQEQPKKRCSCTNQGYGATAHLESKLARGSALEPS